MADFKGRYVCGTGDVKWLELIEKSCEMLHPTPRLPSLPMLYREKYRTFTEGYIWDGWWIQNSYGFVLGANPLLGGEWHKALGRSMDLFWQRQGDGKRIGADDGKERTDLTFLNFRAPDGALGDNVLFDVGIVYRQGDGDYFRYEWFYEATAACLCTQAEYCLFERDRVNAEKHLDGMCRAMEFIEKKRADNGLFLVGPCCNLLAPNWAASYDKETDTFRPSYLTGLSVTYGAALRALRDLAVFLGREDLASLCASRYETTRAALKKMMTKEGYLAKSMDTDGTLHGVYGAEKYGYLDAVCNVDAIAHGMVDEKEARSIYGKIASVEGMRRYGAICVNYPHADDTFWSFAYDKQGPDSTPLRSGDWVDGGCWATVEGRAILSYMKLGAYDDAFRAADTYMKWAEDFRQDSPLAQWGENTCNPWSDEDRGYTETTLPIAVMIDDFATVTCLLRGLFAFIPCAEGVKLKPQIPPTVKTLSLNEPYYFAGRRLFVSYRAGDGETVLRVGETVIRADGEGCFLVTEDVLGPSGCELFFDASDGAPFEKPCYLPEEDTDLSVLPDDLQAMAASLSGTDNAYDREVLQMIRAAAMRRSLPFEDGHFRPMFPAKKQAILDLFDKAARTLYKETSVPKDRRPSADK